jgi:prepilin-type N-terminal cleavage/methylation domain-containing protein
VRGRGASAGFTLIELLVAVALSTILIGVLAMTFSYVTRAQDQTIARLDATRDVGAALEQLEGDWVRAVAVPQVPPPAAFEVSLAAAPVTVDWDGTPKQLRHDALELLVLETVDPDGDGVRDLTRLVRVRWEVRWDAARDEGKLVRVRSPATVPGLPFPTLAAPEEEVMLSPVVELRALPWTGDRFEDPPAVADLPAWRARFVHTGQAASIVAFDLRTTATRFDHLGAGSVVRLEDASGASRFDAGLYLVRLRQLVPGRTPADPTEARLVLSSPPGDAAGDVRYTATWLPSALFVSIDVKVRDSRAMVIRRLGRVIGRSSVDAALVGAGR